jgi:1-deoxy-D-xylulose-5-phosphate synthase
VLMAPKDEDELADMMLTAFQVPGPSAIRYPRGVVAGVARKPRPELLPIGKAEIISPGPSQGPDIAIFGLGPMITMAQDLAGLLDADGFSAAVINPRFIKPLDLEVVEHYGRRAAAFVTFEDHAKSGGFGSALLEALSQLGLTVPVVRIGWPDQFIEHGKVDLLRARYGLTAQAAHMQVLPYLSALRHRTKVAI